MNTGSHIVGVAATVLCTVCVSIASNQASSPREIAPGDPVEDVIARLGQPKGYIKTRTIEVLFFDRGKVEVRDGLVASAEILTPEEVDAKQKRDEKERKAQEEADRFRREARRVEGQEIKETKLSDPAFLTLPAGDQIAYWKRFSALYPDVSLDSAYAARLAEAHRQQPLEQELRSLHLKIKEMEEKVERAEARARAAEEEARRARGRYVYPISYYRLHYPQRSSHHHATVSTPTLSVICQ